MYLRDIFVLCDGFDLCLARSFISLLLIDVVSVY